MSAARVGWIDRSRAFGALAIMFLHVLVSAKIAADLDVATLVVYDVLSVTLTRWAVPAFFMVSGYLLLDPARSVGWRSALRYARRMALALATFGFVFALMEEVVNARAAQEPLSAALLGRSALDVLCGRSWDHLWYVYAQLGLYLLLVPLRAVRARLSERVWRVFVALLFAGALVVPTLMRIEVPNLLVGLACFCLGSLLDRVSWGVGVAACGLVSLAVMLIVSVSGICAGVGDEGYIFLQGSFLAALWALMVLAALRRFCAGPLDASGALARLARDSFGIYLIHPLYIHLVLMVVRPGMLPPVVFEALTCAVVGAATLATVALCRRLPVLRDVV